MQKPLTLSKETSRDIDKVLDRYYIFDERERLIKYAQEKLKKKDVIEFFNNNIFNKAKRLEIALYSSVKKDEKEDNKETKEEKMDIEENTNKEKDKEDKEEKTDTEMNEKKSNKDNEEDDNGILPSYHNVEKVIINDIDDFHRSCTYYDTEFY